MQIMILQIQYKGNGPQKTIILKVFSTLGRTNMKALDQRVFSQVDRKMLLELLL